MQNAYIIDFFLSGMLLIMLFYLYVDVILRLKAIRKVVDSNTLAVAIGQTLGRSIALSIPLVLLLAFLIWRFFAVIMIVQAWGIGAAGLLFIMAVLGVFLIWLDMLLVCINRSGFITTSSLLSQAKSARIKTNLPDPLTPLSQVRIR